MRGKSDKHLAEASCSVCFLFALICLGCSGEPVSGPAVSTSSTMAIAPASSSADIASSPSASTPSPSTSAAPSVTVLPITVAALRAEAAENPAKFKNTKVALDGYFSSKAQKSFGSGEHPVHTFAVVHVALVRGDPDTLACEMSEDTWPPLGLKPGDPIAVSGAWSLDRTLRGGWAEGGGPLHIAGCHVARRSTEK